MKQDYGRQFLLGFAAGIAFGAVFWYWRKSTTADEGALQLLDELAEARARIEQAQARLGQAGQKKRSPASSPVAAADEESVEARTEEADDLTAIKGIGPVYARRLREAGITTYETLAAQEVEHVRQVAKLKAWYAADPAEWIAAAQELSRE